MSQYNFVSQNSINLILFLVLLLVFSHSFTVDATQDKIYDMGFILLALRHTPIDPFFEIRLDEKQNIYVPLSKVFEYLELFLFEINWQGEFITGLIPSDNSYYYFDLKTGQMKRNEEIFFAQKDHYFVENEEIYILYNVLNDWLPVEVIWDDFEFQISIFPDFQLVSEILEERKEKREEYFRRRKAEVKDVLKISPTIFRPGVFNYMTSVKGTGNGFDTSDIAVGYAGEVLFGDFTGAFSISPEGAVNLENFQLKYNNLPIISTAIIGSTSIEFSSLVRESSSVQGVTFNHQDDKHKYGVASINGDVPYGSETELFNNGVLVNFQKAENGEFSFTDVEVQGPINEYEVVIYAPDGRIFRKKINILSRDQQLTPGKIMYSGGVGKNKDDFFASCKGYYGVNQNLTLGGMLEYFDEDGANYKGTYMGGELFYRFLPSLFTYLETQIDLTGQGFGYVGEIQGVYKGFVFRSGLLGYHGIYPPNREITTIGYQHVGVDKKVIVDILKGGSRQKILVRYFLNDFSNHYIHQFQTQYQYRVSLYSDIQLKNTFTLGFDNKWSDLLVGTFSYSGGRFLDMKISTKTAFVNEGLKSPSLSITFMKKENYLERLNYNLDLYLDEKNINLSLGAKYQISDGILLQGSINKNSFNVAVGLSEMRRLKWPFQKIEDGSLNTGCVEGKVYLDLNGNGEWDEGETNLSNVRILVNGHKRTITDQEGKYMIQGLNSGQATSIRVDPASLDILYIPVKEKVWVELRPASGMNLDFGVVPCSGISGYLCGNEELLREISGSVVVVLINENGDEIYRTYPECDGFYVLEKVIPGKYILTVKFPEGVDARSYQPLKYEIEVSGGEIPEWFDGMDFDVR